MPGPGSTIPGGVTGCLQNRGSPNLVPRLTPTLVDSNPRPAGPPQVAGNLKIASFNGLNLYGTFDDTMTDAVRPWSQAEYDLQFNKIVAALAELDTDIIALTSIENTYGPAGSPVLDQLLAALNPELTSRAKESYQCVDPQAAQPWDGLGVGILYRPSDLELVETHAGDGPTPILGATFRHRASGEQLAVLATQCPGRGFPTTPPTDPGNENQGDGQGWNNAARRDSVEEVLSFYRELLEIEDKIVVTGNLNAYRQEEPVQELEDEPELRELLATFKRPTSYLLARPRGERRSRLRLRQLRGRRPGGRIGHLAHQCR